MGVFLAITPLGAVADPGQAQPLVDDRRQRLDRDEGLPNLGPLLNQILRRDGAAGEWDDLVNMVDVSMYVDDRERFAKLAAFLGDRGVGRVHVMEGEPDDVFAGVLQARIPVSLLRALAARPGVSYIRQQVPPITNETVLYPNGPADPMGATAWHEAGFTGEGVRVGKIDGGFSGFIDRISPQLKTPPKFLCGDS